MSAEPALLLEDIRYGWSPQTSPTLILSKLSVPRKSRVLLQGPSGSGKSTLLSLISGILVPLSGQIQVLGTSLQQMKSRDRDRFRVDHLGFLFQQFNLLPYLSLLENVLLPLSFSRSRAMRAGENASQRLQEAQRLLTRLGLRAEWESQRSVQELSVGQQQRVAAARALIGHPELILADEPTSALDPQSKSQLLEMLFEECGAHGITLLLVSHEQDIASHFDLTLDLPSWNQASTPAQGDHSQTQSPPCFTSR